MEQKVREAIRLLSEIRQELSIKNGNGQQYDYVSHPNLRVDDLVTQTKAIERIYYQE